MVTRRGFLNVAISAVVAGVVAGVGGYYAGLLSAPLPGVPATVTKTVTTTTTVTGPPPAVEEIRLGGVLNMTGAYAAWGEASKFGMEKAVEDINKLGGVNVGGRKLPVKLILYDDSSDPTKAASVAAQAILADKVIGLMSGGGVPVTANPISVTADRYKTPFLTGAPFEPWWAAGPFEYAWAAMFRIGTPIPEGDPLYGKRGYTILDIFFAYNDAFRAQTNEKAAIIAADDADGRGWYGIFPKAMAERGYKPLGIERNLGLYPPGTIDFTSMIREWRDNQCEIMWGNLPGPDFGIAWRQCAEMGYRPKIAIIGRAALTYEDITAWGGDLPLGVATEIWWDPSYPYKGIGDTTPASLAERWYKETGRQLNRFIGQGYRDVQIFTDVIERAGTLDKEEINKAIAETDLMTIFGRIKYVAGEHHSATPLTFGQWVKTDKPHVWECPVVYSDHPDLKTTHEPVFPLPSLK